MSRVSNRARTVAEICNLSPETPQNHLQAIFSKSKYNNETGKKKQKKTELKMEES